MNTEDIKSITVIAKKWFDKVNGNTYHSCTVLVNGEEIGHNPFEYGYGEQYRTTALKILQAAGYFNTGERYSNGYSKDEEAFVRFQMDNRNTVKFYVTDVSKRKDL
jgi:hypothetical protein